MYKNFKYLGGWAGKSAMADATRTARHIGHMTYTQAPAVYEKTIFHLFRFTQPVKNYSFEQKIFCHHFSFIVVILHILNIDIYYIPQVLRAR